MDQEKTTNRVDELAKDVLTLARNTLLVNLRFLDAALSQFALESQPGSTMATDGQTLYYDALHVLRSYRDEHAVPARDYLHLVMHCVFRHMYIHKNVEADVWDLACDIAVEHAISGLGLIAVSAEREKKQADWIAELQEEIGMLTAEKIYRFLLTRQLSPEKIQEMRLFFLADDHQLWYAQAENGQSNEILEEPEEAANALFDPNAVAEEIWKDISIRMQVDMETFARKQGDKAEAMMQNLREVNRETYDYAGFLQKFAARGEPMKTDPDEFDYIFYTYGMQLYDKMPLIEPLEYKEVRRIREFVLAVDLSGLVSLEQAYRFLRKTYEVLKNAETFAVKIHLHILTCGGAVPEYVKITNQDEFDAYLSGLKIREPGETDFRPAFLMVDDLVRKHTFRNLKGVIYFTDSIGAFPANKPNYEAVFVFVNDNYSEPAVPPWAVRLVLQKDELNDEHE